jgi:hypothetical protein
MPPHGPGRKRRSMPLPLWCRQPTKFSEPVTTTRGFYAGRFEREHAPEEIE